LYLVQFAGPTRTEWLDSLRANGLSVVQYIHPFTYVVWGEAKALQAVAKFFGAIPKSPRAQRDVANWTRKILVKTGGGNFGLLLDKQRIKVVKGKVPRPDLVMVVEDPAHLIGWTNGDSLVNLIRTGGAGINNLRDMETIFKFDRLHRSIRRDAEERGKK
jgi:hypothetical protein